MKKLLVLSGKGGTGKTTIAAALIQLLQVRNYADCDVDAPNLHITMPVNSIPEQKAFYGLPKARVKYDQCIGCGLCSEKCKFHAITVENKATINGFGCEGCGVCAYVCPVQAIEMSESISGETFVYDKFVHFSTAKLKMGFGASGKLVAQVKKHMVCDRLDELAIIDGSPGIGCPVIASVAGVDRVLLVTEPTISGISDLERIVQTIKHFQVPCVVCINKYDIHLKHTKDIQDYCKQQKLDVIGMIPFESAVSTAINEGKSIVSIDCVATNCIKVMATKLLGGFEDENSSGK